MVADATVWKAPMIVSIEHLALVTVFIISLIVLIVRTRTKMKKECCKSDPWTKLIVGPWLSIPLMALVVAMWLYEPNNEQEYFVAIVSLLALSIVQIIAIAKYRRKHR